VSDTSFPILSAPDLEATAAFYASLGFQETYRIPPEGDPAFVTLERAGATIGIARADADAVDRFAYWLYVADVDATYERLTAAGAAGVEAPADQPWGERVASVRDPAGFLVHLGMPTDLDAT
jgi:lactoylglutathione lyase